MNHISTTPPPPSSPLAVRIWSALQHQIESETSPYLSIERFQLQKDAYLRLADEDVESDVPFFTYEFNEITSDESLDFSLLWFVDILIINTGPTSFAIPYPALAFNSTELLELEPEAMEAADPKVIARNILLIIRLLLNGQLAIGCTFSGQRLLAVETFLLGFETKPYPIALSGEFSLFHRTGHEYMVKQNHLLKPGITIPSNFPLLPPIVNGQRVRRGRTADSLHDLSPLTKKQFDQLDNDSVFHEFMGKDQDEGVWSHFYSSVEFWLTAAVFVAFISFLKYSPLTPGFLHSPWMQPLYVISSWISIAFIAGWLLTRRQDRINRGEHPLTERFEQMVAAIGAARITIVLLNGVLAGVVWYAGVWTPKNDFTNLFSGQQIIAQYPFLWALLGANLIMAILAIVAGRRSSRPFATTIAGLSLVYTVALYWFNEVTMNTADNAPEPSDLAVAGFFFLPFVLVAVCSVVAWRRWRPPRSRT